MNHPIQVTNKNVITNYIIIAAYKIIIKNIYFTIIDKQGNLTSHVYYLNGFNKSENKLLISNSNVTKEMFNFLDSEAYNIGQIQIFENYQLNITNIIIINTKYIYNYCKELTNERDILKTIYYYEQNSINSQILRYEYVLCDYTLEHEKYLLLNINEFNNNNYYTSNDINNNNVFGSLILDKDHKKYYNTWNSYNKRIFKNNELGNINQLTIKILDQEGTLLTNSSEEIIDKYLPNDNLYSKYNTLDYSSPYIYFRHPLYINFQLTLIFELGVYETEIGKISK